MTRKIYLVLLALTLCLGVNAQKTKTARKSTARKTATTKVTKSSKTTSSTSNTGKPIIKFETTQHDFGKVKLGQSKTFEYNFKNDGDGDLVILQSNVFCSCMKVTIPKDPIAPGQTGKIIMKFTGENVGEFMKNAQIYTNCERPMVRINIKGEVTE